MYWATWKIYSLSLARRFTTEVESFYLIPIANVCKLECCCILVQNSHQQVPRRLWEKLFVNGFVWKIILVSDDIMGSDFPKFRWASTRIYFAFGNHALQYQYFQLLSSTFPTLSQYQNLLTWFFILLLYFLNFYIIFLLFGENFERCYV